jgi:phosphatidylinositol dimannoside acyltransferase
VEAVEGARIRRSNVSRPPGAAQSARGRARGAHDRIVDLGYAAGWRGVRAVPAPVAAAAFRRGADLGARRGGPGVRQLRLNLRRVIGPGPSEAELDDLVRAALRSYARYWLETFRLPSMPVASIVPRISTEGAEHVDAAMATGRGAIVALPHSGNWDVAGIWLVARGVPFTTVVERLQPESLFERFVRYRESLGMEIIALSGGSRAPGAVLTERLQAGGCVCLVADRDLGASGVPVEFFGEPTRMPPGPALLAATTGAALLPVSLHFTPDGWGQWIGAPIQAPTGRLRERVSSVTQTLADTFAERISAHPADWHMLQKLWLADLDPARLPATDLATDST